MKLITRNNYEEFFLDYIEGEINAQDKVALESFLAQNPDLKRELDEMMGMDIKYEAETISEDKSLLKDIPFKENFDDFCIAQLEGDIDSYENKAFDEFIQSNPDKAKDLALYHKTKLEADLSIVFKNKKNLKKRNKAIIIRQFVFTTLATAASIAILFSVWTSELENNSTDLKNEKVSQNTSIQIATPDSVKTLIPKGIITVKSVEKNIKPEKTNKTSKPKAKLNIQNKRIIKIDVLPIRTDVSTKESIDKIEVKQLLAESKTRAIKSVDLPEVKVEIIEKRISSEVQNNGLAILGLSWKASKGDDEVKEKSTLLKIASYGVNQIGKLAGKKINLEKKYDPKTDKTRVAFNTLGLGFSTPVK
ncbi:anti-sigma factor family protein [Ancylomarina sp. YFZ004]